MGVTGAHSMSAVVSTTSEMRPRPALVTRSRFGQLGFLTRGLMMGMRFFSF